MATIIIISLISLVFLLVLHEASHFLVAKGFGMKVKEFGIGYPPRLLGRKIKGTLYSLNLIPFGAFVDIPKEEMRAKSLSQRFWVLSAGVISFWVFAFFLLAFSLMSGAPSQVGDSAVVDEAWVQVLAVSSSSPAEKAGIRAGDIITGLNGTEVDKTREVQEFVEENQGENVEIFVKRGSEEMRFEAVPRVVTPEGEGRLGVALSRVTIERWGVLESFKEAGREVVLVTILIVREIGRGIASLFTDVRSRLEVAGPVGIMKVFVERGGLGVSYFLQTMALISLNLAIINILPFLPVADGGRIAFLFLEKVRGKPLNDKIEEGINTFFFVALVLLMALVTIRDIKAF